MSTVSTPGLHRLLISSALLAACGDDGSPLDDAADTTGAAETSGGTDTPTTGVTLTTSDPDTTDDGTTDGTTTGVMPCTVPEDCPDPGTQCLLATCVDEACDTMPVDVGTPTDAQTDGNCQVSQCDGAGDVEDVADSTDLPDDGNECTDDLCNAGTPEHPPLDSGVACAMGGQLCDGAGECVECVDDTVCGGGTCTANVCAPTVIATDPADAAVDVPVDTPTAITFSEAMNPATLDAQTAAGTCTGSIQVSHDDFATCIGFAAAAPAMSGGDTVATLTPAPDLAPGVGYALRVTVAAQSADGVALAAEHLSTFTTAAPTACAGTVRISQVYGGGGNAGAPFLNDFIELHNNGSVPVTLDGWSVQYASSTGSTWPVTPLQGTIAPGGYVLVWEDAGAGGNGVALPTADVTGSISMSATNGKVALVSDTAALAGGCPTGAPVVDFVGYGNADCFEAAATAALSNTSSAHRDVAGCVDTDDNSSDFIVATLTADQPPQSSGSPVALCSCPLDGVANETDTAAEADFCNLQSPTTIVEDPETVTPQVFGRIFEAGVTEAAGEPAGVIAELGYGRPPTTIDDLQSGWAWHPAAYNVQVGNDDEYVTTFTAPAASTPAAYGYTYRFSLDGGASWTYCDANGAGSNDTLVFEAPQVGVMTVGAS